jgi:hypothetical protein
MEDRDRKQKDQELTIAHLRSLLEEKQIEADDLMEELQETKEQCDRIAKESGYVMDLYLEMKRKVEQDRKDNGNFGTDTNCTEVCPELLKHKTKSEEYLAKMYLMNRLLKLWSESTRGTSININTWKALTEMSEILLEDRSEFSKKDSEEWTAFIDAVFE